MDLSALLSFRGRTATETDVSVAKMLGYSVTKMFNQNNFNLEDCENYHNYQSFSSMHKGCMCEIQNEKGNSQRTMNSE